MVEVLRSISPEVVRLTDFAVQFLAVEAALATYRSEHGDGAAALPSSIWIHRDGRWQMRFHQGTVLP